MDQHGRPGAGGDVSGGWPQQQQHQQQQQHPRVPGAMGYPGVGLSGGNLELGLQGVQQQQQQPGLVTVQGMAMGMPIGSGTVGGSGGSGTSQYQQQQQQQQPQPQPHQPPPPPHIAGPTSAAGSVTVSAPSPATASQGSSAPASAAPSAKPIRRRMRMITSCLECRRRKLKCGKSQPCANCVRFRRDCVYMGPKLDEAGQLRLTQIKDKVGSLELQLERDLAQKLSGAARQQRILADDVEGGFADGRGLEPSEMVALDHTYEDTTDDTDEVIDLGVLVGRMRITDRIAGFSRPRVAEEISANMRDQTPSTTPQPRMPSQPASLDFSLGTSDPSWPDYLRPGTTYIPPSSGLLMGQPGAAPSLEALLPSQGAADRLIQQYFEAVHPVVRCVHRPSLEAGYREFWGHVIANVEPRPSLQAMVFAAMFSGAVSMDECASQREFGKSQKDLYEALKLGTETALTKANFLRTTRFETLQALVMYMLPLCRDELSRAHSVLVGAAIRMAECMGLHRDGETYGLSPLDTHVRRLVWHQLCFLDIRTSEAHGPRPTIRRDDYETKLPLNCNDEAFIRDSPTPPQPAEGWTSMMWPLMRFEINEMMRIIWLDRRRAEAKQITLTAVLAKVENFRRAMLDKYNGHLDDAVPMQRYARLVMHLFLCRLRAMTLHAYHFNASAQLPPRLTNVLITSGIMICEIGIQLETNPLFRSWKWYAGAYHQFQIALLLALEVYLRPHSSEAGRIWACLDYVFQMDRGLPAELKGKMILKEVMEKVTAYQSMRKSRAPSALAQAVPGRGIIGKGTGGTVDSHVQPQQQQQQQQQYHQHQHQSQPQHTAPHQVPSHRAPLPPTSTPMPMGTTTPPASFIPSTAAITTTFPATAVTPHPQPLWGLPQTRIATSECPPGSNIGAPGVTMPMSLPPDMGIPMPDMNRPLVGVDWEVIDSLFTNDPATGELSIPGYHDPSLTMNW